MPNFNLAVVHRREQDPDNAIPAYEKAVALAPNMYEAWYDLGYMYKLNHEQEKAVAAFQTYLDLTKGTKEVEGPKRIEGELEAMGAKPNAAPVKAPAATPAPKVKGKGSKAK